VSYQGTLAKNPNFTANANAKATSTAQVSREKAGFLAEFEVVRSDISLPPEERCPHNHYVYLYSRHTIKFKHF
jgi:hypothetical protein